MSDEFTSTTSIAKLQLAKLMKARRKQRLKREARYEPEEEPLVDVKEVAACLADQIGCSKRKQAALNRNSARASKKLIKEVSAVLQAQMTGELKREVVAASKIITEPSERPIEG